MATYSSPYSLWFEFKWKARKFVNKIKHAIIDRIHLFFFELYINHPDAIFGGLIGMWLPKNELLSDSGRVSLWIPALWTDRFTEAVSKRSKLYSELRTRTTTSDRIVQPSLVQTDRYKDAKGASVITDVYSQVIVPLKTTYLTVPFSRADWQPTISLSLMDLSSDELANLIDSNILARKYNEKSGFESLFDNPRITEHESKGMSTVSGYVVSNMNNHDQAGTDFRDIDVWKEALFHLPQGYRQRAKWYMHPDIGLYIGTLSEVDDVTNERHYLARQGDNIQSDGTPVEILNKPIIYNDKITGREIIAILGDLTRGYIIAAPRRMWLTIDSENGYKIGLKTGGQVLQPAAIKAVKAPYPVAQEVKEQVAQ